jgi:hypothetical protein
VASEVVLRDAGGDHVVYQDSARRKLKRARRQAIGLLADAVLNWAERTRPAESVSCLAIVHSFEPYDLSSGLAWGLERELRDRAALGIDAYRAAEFQLYDPLPPEFANEKLDQHWSVLRQVWSDAAADDEPGRLFNEVAAVVASKVTANRAPGFFVFAVEADYTDLQQRLNAAGVIA